MASEPSDWQLECTQLKQRGAHLLQSGLWSDCSFLVGMEPHQVVVRGHKLILAMASPVFGAMFYGEMAEKYDPIPVPDVQPEAFKALLEYIYTDNINIGSLDKACKLYYGAKKYMLPHLVKECMQYLLCNLNPKYACQAYEFATLFEENDLMQTCLQTISLNTTEVLTDSSFEDVALDTVIAVFSLEHLNVASELELFEALLRYARARDGREPERGPDPAATTEKVVNVNSGADCSPEAGDAEPRRAEPEPSPPDARPESGEKLTIRSAVDKIRFLTLTPQQFLEGPASARPALLAEPEALAVLKHLLSSHPDVPLPWGFSPNREPRNCKGTFRFRFTVTNLSYLKAVSSLPCYVRNWSWKILVESGHHDQEKFLGVYLKCNGESKSSSWSRNVDLELRLISHKPFSLPYANRVPKHLFCSKENIWGFPKFMAWKEVLDPAKGYIKDDAITLEAHVTAERGPD